MIADIAGNRYCGYVKRADLCSHRLGALGDKVIDCDTSGVVTGKSMGDCAPRTLASACDEGDLALQVQWVMFIHAVIHSVIHSVIPLR
jgi:hypothetical protein